MRLSVLFRDAQIQGAWIQNKPILWYLKMRHLIMAFGIYDHVIIGRQPFAEMDVVAIRAEAFLSIGFDYNFAVFDGFRNFLIGKNHVFLILGGEDRGFMKITIKMKIKFRKQFENGKFYE